MHSIERYGIVALLFLVVTVVAVLLWDGGKKKEQPSPAFAVPPVKQAMASEGAGARPATKGPSALPRTDSADELGASDDDARLTLVADARPGPLQREPAADSLEGTPTPSEGQPLRDEEPARFQAEAAPSTDRGAARARTTPSSGSTEERRTASDASARRGYVVRPGDTLSEVAQRELGSSKRWKEIVALNPGLDPSSLHVGKELRLPEAPLVAGATPGAGAVERQSAASAKPPTSSSGSSTGSAASSATWKVGRGENLWKIAERTLGDGKRWREIADLNPSIDPDKLKLGATLKLPAGRASGNASGAAPKTAQSSSSPKKGAAKKAAPVLVASAPSSDRPSRRGGKVR